MAPGNWKRFTYLEPLADLLIKIDNGTKNYSIRMFKTNSGDFYRT